MYMNSSVVHFSGQSSSLGPKLLTFSLALCPIWNKDE